MAVGSAEGAPLSHVGEALRPGRPEFTDDGRFWDGTRLYVQRDKRVRKGASTVLRAAAVLVEARMDCCPGEVRCGTTRLVGERDGAVIRSAGFVRFREPEGHLEAWESDDGTTLAMLAGHVTRPLENAPS